MNKVYNSIATAICLFAILGCNSKVDKTGNGADTGLLTNPWEYAKEIEHSIVTPAFKDTVYNILDFGAISNSITDCIAIKSGRNNDGRNIGHASEDFIIRNCEMVEGHGGVVMGSELSGDVRYVFAENCIMDSPNLERAIRIESNSLRGGTIEHIYARNIKVKEVREAILKINMYYSNETGNNIPIARNILLESFTGYKSKHGFWIKAYADSPAKNIILRNCDFRNVEKGNLIENADNLSFENVLLNGGKL